MVVDEELLGGLALASSPNSSASRKPNLTPPAYLMSALRMLMSMLKRRLASEISGESTVVPGKAELHQGIAAGHPLGTHPILILLGHFQVDGGVDEIPGQLGLGIAEEPGHFPCSMRRPSLMMATSSQIPSPRPFRG